MLASLVGLETNRVASVGSQGLRGSLGGFCPGLRARRIGLRAGLSAVCYFQTFSPRVQALSEFLLVSDGASCPPRVVLGVRLLARLEYGSFLFGWFAPLTATTPGVAVVIAGFGCPLCKRSAGCRHSG
jgi:hypothetical protein